MEFKGTKGKWTCRQDYDKKYNQPVIEIDARGSDNLCTVWNGQSQEMLSETKADALLISKAPEMLEMLNKLYSQDLLKDYEQEVLDLIKSATEL